MALNDVFITDLTQTLVVLVIMGIIFCCSLASFRKSLDREKMRGTVVLMITYPALAVPLSPSHRRHGGRCKETFR